jgi:hypothetical protein
MTDPIPASEIEQIRGRHINKHDDPDFSESDGYDAHNDRWTLLRALDAATEENARLRSAFFVNENGVGRMLRFLAESGHRVDPIVMSSAVGLYVETMSRAALKEPGNG